MFFKTKQFIDNIYRLSYVTPQGSRRTLTLNLLPLHGTPHTTTSILNQTWKNMYTKQQTMCDVY